MWPFNKNAEKIEALEKTVQQLKWDIEEIKLDSQIRVGVLSYAYMRSFLPDPRPSISNKDAIKKIIDHLGLELDVMPASASEIRLTAKKPENPDLYTITAPLKKPKGRK